MTCAHYTSMVNDTKHVVIKSADVVKITADTIEQHWTVGNSF